MCQTHSSSYHQLWRGKAVSQVRRKWEELLLFANWKKYCTPISLNLSLFLSLSLSLSQATVSEWWHFSDSLMFLSFYVLAMKKLSPITWGNPPSPRLDFATGKGRHQFWGGDDLYHTKCSTVDIDLPCMCDLCTQGCHRDDPERGGTGSRTDAAWSRLAVSWPHHHTEVGVRITMSCVYMYGIWKSLYVILINKCMFYY